MNTNEYLIHTALKPDTTLAEIEKICNEAIQYNFKTVCVPPLFVKKATDIVKEKGIKVATVIGFPFGYSAIEAKVAETVLAILDGADELNVVINICAVKNNDWQYLAGELNNLMPIVKSKNKSISITIESGLLSDDEIIKCCDLYGIAGVDNLCTSTGFTFVNATVENVLLIRKHLADKIGIIANGDIKNNTFANQLINAGASRIGCNGTEIVTDTV